MEFIKRPCPKQRFAPAVLAGLTLGVAMTMPHLWWAEAAPAKPAGKKPVSGATSRVMLDAQDHRVTTALNKALRSRVTGAKYQLKIVPTARAGEGYFSEVYVTAHPARIKKMRLTDFALRARNVRVDVPHLMRTGKVATLHSLTTLRAVVSESDLTAVLAQGKHSKAMGLKVKYLGDRIRVAGNWNWGLLSGPVVAEGRLYLAPGYKVNVDVTSLKLNGAEVPAFVKSKFMERLNPLIDYQDVPFQPRFKGVKVVGDKAIITA